MVQLQFNITFKNGKLDLQSNQLRREDADEVEIEAAKHLEKIVEGVLLASAKQSGLRVRTRRVKGKKDAIHHVTQNKA